MHSFFRDSGFDRQVASVSATILFMGSLLGKISCGFLLNDLEEKGFNLIFHWVYIRFNSSDDSSGYQDALFIWFGLGIFGTGFGGIYTLKA